eukprot:CAMPEP_0117654956 /NCGR_PEP_ID=MMETSP0804-20121206/4024_1 /TAXON_ID=1074897 /ORGANISM="Tetraselmis astigmatica, Strain CCMP880" /LENGTH=263 /DNA_ID=CAMNT_0005461279 /DNA_START=98 /DNA_END=889 /DNA_ORIENTATION=-
MPIPALEKEKLRHEMRKMLNRKNNKNRLHKVQKNVQVYEIGMPLLPILERKLGIELDSIRRGFCLNEVRLSAKRATNKANKYGLPEEPEKEKTKPPAMANVYGSAVSGGADEKGEKQIFRQRLHLHQVEKLQKIAEDAGWSLLKIPRPQRDHIASHIGITVEQFKNFFSNAKPKDKKKAAPRKEGDPSDPINNPPGEAGVYRQRLSVWQIEELTKAAVEVNWSLAKIAKPDREVLSKKVGITVDQLKNFFSNAKPDELKKSAI